MNSKSGSDSQPKTESSAPSPEQPLSESSPSKGSQEDLNFLVPSGIRNGDPRAIRKAAANDLALVAEKTSGKKITEEGRRYLQQFVDSTSRGFVGSMTMTCMATNCPFLSSCPLHKIGAELPKGDPCPVEKVMISTWITKHLQALGIEDMENPAHSFDMDMLYELAGQELLRWRCSVHLSDDPRLVSTQQVSATTQGDPIFADVINPVLDIMERAGRNISKIRDALVATREAQVKAGQVASDPSVRAAELKEKAMKAAKLRREQQELIKDATFEVKDKDA